MKLKPQNPTPGMDGKAHEPIPAPVTNSEILDLFGDVVGLLKQCVSNPMGPDYVSRQRALNACYEKLNHLRSRL